MDRPPSGPGRGDGSQLRFAIVGPLLASPPPKGGLQAEFRRFHPTAVDSYFRKG